MTKLPKEEELSVVNDPSGKEAADIIDAKITKGSDEPDTPELDDMDQDFQDVDIEAEGEDDDFEEAEPVTEDLEGN